MSQIFTLGGNAFAFNQRWYHLTGEDGERQEITRYAKDASSDGGTIRFVTTVHNRGVACGFYQGNIPKTFRKTIIFSAAAVFAAVCGTRDALLTYAINDVVAVVGIKDGLPDPETDWLGNFEEAVSIAQRFIQENGDRTISVFDNAGIFTDAQPFDFGTVTVSLDLQEKHLQVLPLRRSYIVPFAFFLLAIGVPLVYYGFIEDYLLQKKREEAARQAVDPVVVYMVSVRAALTEELSAPARVYGEAYKAVIDGQSMYKDGWVLRAIECAGPSCSGIWENQPWGTHENFLTGKDPATVQLALPGIQIREQLLVQPPVASGSATPEEKLPSLFDFLKKDITTLQHYRMAGMTFNLQEAVPFGSPPGVTPPSDVPGGIVLRGEWQIGGALGVYAEALNGLPDNMALKALTIRVTDDQIESNSFVAEGYYYVRSR